MVIAMPMTKVSVGKSGYGAAHASYITRMSALDPPDRHKEPDDRQPAEQMSLPISAGADAEPTKSETLNDHLNERALKEERSMAGTPARDADPIWTWNAPEFLTGERQETRAQLADKSGRAPGEMATDRRSAVDSAQGKLTRAEKV